MVRSALRITHEAALPPEGNRSSRRNADTRPQLFAVPALRQLLEAP
jgi:hypothetical protein